MHRILSLLTATVALAVGPAAVSASPGTPVELIHEFDLTAPVTATTTVSIDVAGILCSQAISHLPGDIEVPGDFAAGPRPRGQQGTFVGTVIRTAHCQGTGWSEDDTFAIKETIHGNNDGLTAHGYWRFVGGTGRLAGIHGGGTIFSTLEFFPVVHEVFTGTVALDPS